MPITDFLEKNARLHPNEVSLVEVNPENQPDKNISWHEYSLIEASGTGKYRRELTWREFDIAANRFANLLLTRGVKKGDKVAILMMNCIDWLPIYFGIMKSGAIAVPMNFRFSADEIEYCSDLADISVLVFGPEFIERIESVLPKLRIKDYFFVGENTPSFADNYGEMITYCSSAAPAVEISDEDDGAIYFSSGTTGFPKAILHRHKALVTSCQVEQKHHSQSRDDVFLCIPPLYHTGAKMHWFGSLLAGSKAVILRGIKPEWILQTVSDEKATIVWLLVPWAQDILDAIERGDIDLSKYRLSQWRLMHIGAQPVPPSLIKRWKEVFPNHDYDTNYGLSE
ncbi:MAG: acyl--CoA ligase, partial [Clostridia bacterium]|nr:acyl--CoA ligase [Clostridia bacterium]